MEAGEKGDLKKGSNFSPRGVPVLQWDTKQMGLPNKLRVGGIIDPNRCNSDTFGGNCSAPCILLGGEGGMDCDHIQRVQCLI